MAGKYIVIEGGDGAGKDTQLKLLEKHLVKLNISFIAVHEPYDRILGEHMTAILRDANPTKSMSALDPWQQAMLYNAARRGIMLGEVKPAIESGKWVIASRNYISTLAYQGYGGNMDQDEISSLAALCELGTAGVEPDLTIILDIDPLVGRSRQLGKGRDSFERSGLNWHMQIRKGYLELAKSKRYPVVNGDQTIERVASDILKLLPALAAVNHEAG